MLGWTIFTETVKLRIVPIGIYRSLLCHRQKHLETGSGKATVFFVVGGLFLHFSKYRCQSLHLKILWIHSSWLRSFLILYKKCKQIFSTENRLINTYILMLCRFLLRKCHYGKDANCLWKHSCKPTSLRDALHLTEPERLLLSSQTVLFPPKITVQDTGRIKELNWYTFALDYQLW